MEPVQQLTDPISRHISSGDAAHLDAFIRQLQADDIEQACRMTDSQKLRAGGDLFDDACRWTMAGIRAQHPGITNEEALAELRRRIAQDQPSEPA